MELLIDIGNTCIKWAELNNESLSNFNSIVYRNQNLHELFNQIWNSLESPERVLISNVTGKDFQNDLQEWLKQKWSSNSIFVQSTNFFAGVTNNYLNPEQLGVDRWMALIAAHNRFNKDICIFDCGTAITLDLIKSDGNFMGGLIFPGIQLLKTSLINNTNGCKIQKNSQIHYSNQFLANNTQDSVDRGSFNAALAIIEYQKGKITERLGADVIFILTGGDGATLLPFLSQGYQHLPHLVLEGLSIYAKNNK